MASLDQVCSMSVTCPECYRQHDVQFPSSILDSGPVAQVAINASCGHSFIMNVGNGQRILSCEKVAFILEGEKFEPSQGDDLACLPPSEDPDGDDVAIGFVSFDEIKADYDRHLEDITQKFKAVETAFTRGEINETVFKERMAILDAEKKDILTFYEGLLE